LAAIHWLTPLDIEDSARWLNAFCLFGTTLLILRPAHLRFLSVFVFAALILGPALWETHLFLWSESLFLFFLALLFRTMEFGISKGEISTPTIAAIGFVCGTLTLTRYAGLFVLPCVLGTLFALRRPLAETLKKAFVLAMTYCLVIGPWFLYLQSIGRTARSLTIRTQGFPTEMLHTLVLWLVPDPYWSSFPTGWEWNSNGWSSSWPHPSLACTISLGELDTTHLPDDCRLGVLPECG
jgi:hypothetical protein